MPCRSGEVVPSGEAQTLSQFALVAYIPGPLGRFLDDLRLELTPGCRPRAHVTILPPRPLHHEVAQTIQQIDEQLKPTEPFRIELGEIEIFEASNVVYLGLARGADEMCALYRALNCRYLEYQEPFPYHPHITLAQNIAPEDSLKLAGIARERWRDYRGPRGFDVSVISFVQNVAPWIWVDVAALPVGTPVPVAG